MSLKHLIFSSNTSIGKTLLSLSLSSHITKTKPLTYIKPLQCGTPWDEDLIKTYSDTTNLNLNSITIKAYDPYPCSPHLASILTGERTKEYITDDEINENILNSITSGHNIIETAGGVLSPSIAFPSAPLKGYMSYKDTNLVYTTQANLYSRLNLPSILVGDPKLGGVSTTISSLESLLSHGNRVEGIVFFGNDKRYVRTREWRDY